MMYDNDSKGISYLAGFFMLIAFTVAGLALAAVISIPVWTSMTGRPVTEMADGLGDPQFSNVAKVLQAVQAIFGFIVPAVFTAALLSRKPFKLMGFAPGMKIKQAGLVILLLATALIVSSALHYVNNKIPVPDSWKTVFDEWERDYNEKALAIVGLRNATEYVLALVVMAFLPALGEEMLFRGGLQNYLTRATKRPWLAIIVAGIIFSAVHFSWYLFLPRLFLGVILGFIYYYSGNLWLSVFGHFLNNAYVVTALYIYQLKGKSLQQALADNTSSIWGILLLPVLIGLMLLFQRVSFGSTALTRRQGS